MMKFIYEREWPLQPEEAVSKKIRPKKNNEEVTMPATTSKIHVTACDNELYLIASTPAGSSELLHMKSGYNDPVEYVVRPFTNLAKGQYDLTMIGINWGGPAAFKVTVTVGGVDTIYASPASSAVGVVWTKTVPMTI